jgi:hypothetical protein
MSTQRALLASCLIAGIAFAWHAFAADDVTIYRCVDAKGHETLRDTPCTAKETQKETRTMVRPKDAAPRPAPVAPVHEAPEPVRHSVSYVSPPRPLYECITPDNVRYTSDTGDGNPRWVPLWTMGYPIYRGVTPGQAGVNFSFGNDHVAVAGGTGIVTPPIYTAAGYGGSTWVRDTCYMLPQADVCDRVRDRRDEIRRRFFNAMPSERDVLRVEERTLNARLDADCAAE